MHYQGEILCASIFALIPIIWFLRKKSVITERSSNKLKDNMNNMTWIIQKIEEKEIQIRNLTEENYDLRQLNSEQSKVLSELYDCDKKIKNIEKLYSAQKEALSLANKEITKLNCQVKSMTDLQNLQHSDTLEIKKLLLALDEGLKSCKQTVQKEKFPTLDESKILNDQFSQYSRLINFTTYGTKKV